MHFGQKYHLTKKNGILAHFIGIKNVFKNTKNKKIHRLENTKYKNVDTS